MMLATTFSCFETVSVPHPLETAASGLLRYACRFSAPPTAFSRMAVCVSPKIDDASPLVRAYERRVDAADVRRV